MFVIISNEEELMNKLNYSPILPCRIYYSRTDNIYIDFLKYERRFRYKKFGDKILKSPFNVHIRPSEEGFKFFKDIDTFELDIVPDICCSHVSELNKEKIKQGRMAALIICDFKYVPRVLRSLLKMNEISFGNTKTFISSYKAMIKEITKLAIHYNTINTAMFPQK